MSQSGQPASICVFLVSLHVWHWQPNHINARRRLIHDLTQVGFTTVPMSCTEHELAERPHSKVDQTMKARQSDIGQQLLHRARHTTLDLASTQLDPCMSYWKQLSIASVLQFSTFTLALQCCSGLVCPCVHPGCPLHALDLAACRERSCPGQLEGASCAVVVCQAAPSHREVHCSSSRAISHSNMHGAKAMKALHGLPRELQSCDPDRRRLTRESACRASSEKYIRGRTLQYTTPAGVV